MNLNGGRFNSNNKNNNNSLLPVLEYYLTRKMTYEILIELLYDAYYSCRKNKGRKPSAVQFGWNYERELEALAHELLDGTYILTTSIVFGITRPKDREVFAANFRDRVVHHLLMNRFLPVLDGEMIEDSFNCRVGKGVFHGVKRLSDEIRRISCNYTKPTYVLSGDIEGFFMSINKEKLWQMVERTIRDNCRDEDLEWWLRLFRIVLMNRPENDCIIRGDKRVLDRLPCNKSLLKGDGKNGLPIGNLPSQICGNFYRTPFDKMMRDAVGRGGYYCVFVDDFRVVCTDKRKLELLAVKAREYLWQNLGLKMHTRKFTITEVRRGVKFIGAVIKPWGTYTGNRTVNHAFSVARMSDVGDMKRHVQRLNSYYGFMTHGLTYAIRRNLYDAIPAEIKKKIVCVGMKKFVLSRNQRCLSSEKKEED